MHCRGKGPAAAPRKCGSLFLILCLYPQGVARARRSFRDEDQDQGKRQEKENKDRTRKDNKALVTLFPETWTNLVSDERKRHEELGYQTDLGLLRVAISENEISRVGELFDKMCKTPESQSSNPVDAFTATEADVEQLIGELSNRVSQILPTVLVTDLQHSFQKNEVAPENVAPKGNPVPEEELGRVISRSALIDWWMKRQELECSVLTLQNTAKTLGWSDKDLSALQETLRPDQRREVVFKWPKEKQQPKKQEKQPVTTIAGASVAPEGHGENEEIPGRMLFRMQSAIDEFVTLVNAQENGEPTDSKLVTAVYNAFKKKIVTIYGSNGDLAEEHVHVEKIQSGVAQLTGGVKSDVTSMDGDEGVQPAIIVVFTVDSSIVKHDDTTLETKIKNSAVGHWCPFRDFDVTDVAAGDFWKELAKEKTPPTVEMCAISISFT
jgi:hypothetical protein